MKKLTLTLDSFSKAEKRNFAYFIDSPYFNQREDVKILYQWILKNPKSEIGESTFKAIYPNTPISEQRSRLVLSYLQRLAEEFLSHEHWRQKPGAYEGSLLQVMRIRGLENHFNEVLRTAKQTLDQQDLRNSDYHIQLGQVLWEEARFESLRNPTESKYLEHLSDHSDLTWILQKLRFLCLNRMQHTMYKFEYILPLRSEVEVIIVQRAMLNNAAVATWYYCLKMLEEPESILFFDQFKAAYLNQNQLFDHEEIRDLYLFALNYCIRRANSGEKIFFHDIMGFYKDGLKKGYILDNGVLSRSTYHNIVAAGLQTFEFEWVEEFIANYKNYLERTYRDSSYSFNMARLEFARKRYDNALVLLQHSHYYDPLLNLAAKTMSLKIYYELGEHDLLEAHLEALKIYIRRKVTMGYHRTNYLNLVKYTLKLITINRFNKKEIENLSKKIAAEPVLTERDWLLEQLAKDINAKP